MALMQSTRIAAFIIPRLIPCNRLHTLSRLPPPSALRPSSAVYTPRTLPHTTDLWYGGRRWSSDIAAVPKLSDPDANDALNALLSGNWESIHSSVREGVEGALAKSKDSTLSTVWTSAQAVEKFAGTLSSLRMELGELNGKSGETVRPMPDSLRKALQAALKKYQTYLASFDDDEEFLKKKVQNELGSILIQIKQRCSGLGPEWGR